MNMKSNQPKASAEQVVTDIRRATRRHYSTQDKIRIVLSSLRGEDSIAELCRKEGIAQGLCYSWSKEFLEAGKKFLAGDTARAATNDEVLSMRSQTQALKGALELDGAAAKPSEYQGKYSDNQNNSLLTCQK